MSPHEFLILARELQAAPSEAHWRTAVSRAYYAAFHTARQLLRTWGFQIGTADQAHAGITRRLAASKRADLEKASRELSELRSKRNVADYDLDRAFLQETAVKCVSAAGLVLNILNRDFALEQKQQAIQAMRDYERNVLRDVTWRSLN